MPGTREIRAQRSSNWMLPALGAAVVIGSVGAWLALSGGGEARLELLPGQAVIRGGERIQITPAVTGSVDGDEEGVQWVSSNTSVATVGPDGLVTGIGPGQAEITARIGMLAASTDITVSGADDVASGGGGRDEGPSRRGGERETPRPASLTLARTSVSLSSVAGEGPPEAGSVAVEGAGLSSLRAEVVYPPGGAPGWLEAVLSGATAPARLSLVVHPEAVPVGRHEATVDVSAAGGASGRLRVSYEKTAAGSEEVALALAEVDEVLDRQVNRLLDGVSGAALQAVGDTARMVWALEAASNTSRAQAAFVLAQAELVQGNPQEALTWAERAVSLAPGNDGYRRLRDDLRGGDR